MSALALVHSLDALSVQAIDACRRAQAESDRFLRNVREAGRLLAEVQRQPGTSSDGLTRLQAVIRAVGISRDTANRWQRVAAVPLDIFEDYIRQAQARGDVATISGLIDRPKSNPRKDDPSYAHQVDVLAQKFGTSNKAETIRRAVQFAYDQILRERCGR